MMETPDSFSGSAISARDQIGKAIALKIKETSNAAELSKITQKVLPEIEKFLESPEEKKLRRVRNGSMVSLIGLGTAIGFFIASQFGDPEVIVLAAFGLITFFIGLALTVNGMFFTVPKKSLLDGETSESDFQQGYDSLSSPTNELLMPPSAQSEFSSVTENTTRHLKNKKPSFK
jgi:hypothetical protein